MSHGPYHIASWNIFAVRVWEPMGHTNELKKNWFPLSLFHFNGRISHVLPFILKVFLARSSWLRRSCQNFDVLINLANDPGLCVGVKGKTGMTPLTPSSVSFFSLPATPTISQASPTIRQRLQLTPTGVWALYALFSIDAPLRSSSPPCNTPHIESEPISPFLIHMGLLRRHWHSSSRWESGPPFELSSMRMRSIVRLRRMTSDGLIHYGCHGPC